MLTKRVKAVLAEGPGTVTEIHLELPDVDRRILASLLVNLYHRGKLKRIGRVKYHRHEYIYALQEE